MRLEELRLSADELNVLGGRIKAARKSAHYTQNRVSEILECSIGHLSAIENGKTMPSGDEIVCFCKLYRKDLFYYFRELLEFDGEPSKEPKKLDTEKYGYISDETLKWNIRAMSDFVKQLKDEEARREQAGKK